MVGVDNKSLMSKMNRFCTRSLEAAAGLCVSRTNYEVTVEHFLHVMCEEIASDIWCTTKAYGLDPTKFRTALLETIEGYRTGNAGRPVFSPILIEWLQTAWMIGTIDMNLSEIRSGVLLATMLSNPTRFCSGEYYEKLSTIKPDDLKRRFFEVTEKSIEGAARKEAGAKEGAAGGSAKGGEGALGKYGIHFTERARKGEIDPVFGRDREIRQMVDILARRRKNNPIVVGEAGVGKTALVEGLAVKIVEGGVPEILRNVEIYGLDMGLLQAGAGVKGEFENRLKEVLKEVKASATPIIMFIDEAHTLIGAGGAAGGGDAANLLKPALARGELRTVAATTWSEYKKYFEKDAALARRFQLVKVEEPGEDDTVTMLRGLRERYEASHNVLIRDDALVAAARLGSRYISGRQQPDKGVDLVDTAAARVKVALTTKPDTLQDLEIKIQNLERELAAHKRDQTAGAKGREERIAEVEEEIKKLRGETKKTTERWEKEKGAAQKVLDLRKKLADAAKSNGEKKAEEKPRETKRMTKVVKKDDMTAPVRQELEKALEELHEVQGKEPLVPVEVDPETIARVVSDWTGIPIGKMVRDEAQQILQFEETLGKRIKGQGHVLEVVAKGIRAAKSGLKNPRTPMGVFLFVGPSGVGKTETGLAVADTLFGGERFMTVVNMSEFQEKHTVSRLIGSPPGYVGYGEGGVLTEAVRQRPYSVVLLDEVEKADPDVMNLFYQVFDKGMLSDGEGREVDFKDTIIFMTSNLATDVIMEACTDGKRPEVDELVSQIRPVLSRHFKPALLARMTIVPFYPIGGDAMKEIVRLKLSHLQNRLWDSHRMQLKFEAKVIESIADRCREVETGARNIDHIMSGTLLPRISTEVLQQMSLGPLPDKLSVGVDEKGEFAYTFSSK